MVPVRPGGGLISHTHDSSTPKLHPGRVLGSTAIFTAAAPGVDLRKCVSLCILQYTTLASASLHSLLYLHSPFPYPLLPPLIFFSLPLSSSPLSSSPFPLSSSPFPSPLLPSPSPLLPSLLPLPLILFSLPLSSSPSPYLLLPSLILFSLPLLLFPLPLLLHFLLFSLLLHLNLIVLQRLAVFKEVNRKLGMLHTTNNRPFLPHTRPQHCKGTRGLKLRLQPVFCVGIVVGDIDSEAAIFTQNNECSAVL